MTTPDAQARILREPLERQRKAQETAREIAREIARERGSVEEPELPLGEQ